MGDYGKYIPAAEVAKVQKIFKQEQFSIPNSTGKKISSDYESRKDLERVALWLDHHVEDRLRGACLCVPNMWVQSLKPKPPISWLAFLSGASSH